MKPLISVPALSRRFSERLEEAAAAHPVAGAAAALRVGRVVVDAAVGVTNVDDPKTVGTDTRFPIYSIGKLVTAGLIMGAEDQGVLQLGTPILGQLAGDGSPSAQGWDSITLQHLLTHSSGIPGDFLLDTGTADSCVSDYVSQCRTLELFHDPGRLVSYSNAGFVVAGAILERLTGRPFDDLAAQCMREMGLPPANADSIIAVTHLRDPETGRLTPSPGAGYPRSLGPAGAGLTASALDLLKLASFQFNAYPFLRPARYACPATHLRMQRILAAFPAGMGVLGVGLGWMVFSETPRVVGHDGAGMNFLRVLPDEQVAFTLLTNGGDSAGLFDRMFQGVLDDLGYPAPRDVARSRAPRSDVARCAGVYSNMGLRVSIEPEGDGLRLRIHSIPGSTSSIDPEYRSLRQVGDEVFEDRDQPRSRYAFPGLSGGRPNWLQYGVRALRREPSD